MAAVPLMVTLRDRATLEHEIRSRHDELTTGEGALHFTRPQLRYRREVLQDAYTRYTEVARELIGASEEQQLPQILDENERVRLMYFETMAIIDDSLMDPTMPIANTTTNPIINSLAQGGIIRVETQRAPEPGEFSGNPANWPAFRDRFKAEVHERDLDDVTKLILLQRACTGDAKSTLGEWCPIAINYQRAWQTLTDRYEDSYKLQQAIIGQIFAIKRQERETQNGLRIIIDVTSSTLRQLEAMEVNVDGWDPIIIHRLVSRLSKYTADAWEQKRSVENVPSLKDLITFLEARARGRAYIEPAATTAPEGASNNIHHHKYDNGGQRRGRHQFKNDSRNGRESHKQDRTRPYFSPQQINTKQDTHADNAQEKRPERSCPMCAQNHPIFRCDKFKTCPLNDRIRLAQKWKLCENCLLRHKGECSFRGCNIHKDQKHNPLLCESNQNPIVSVIRAQAKQSNQQ